MGHLLRK
jgi:hypothetical protein